MLKKILETIGTRYLIAILNLALIFINAKALGIEGVGLVGLIVASVNIAVIFNGIFSGNTIVYFMNKYPVQTIVCPAYLWTFIGSGLACGFLFLTGLLPVSYGLDIYLVSVLSSLVVANTRILLGKENMKGFNMTYMLQGGLLFFALLYFYYVAHEQTVRSYIWGMYITNGIAFVVSCFLVYPILKRKSGEKIIIPLGIILKEMFAYGLWAGADNLAEVLTTRLNYFLIKRLGGLSSVGLLDAGTKISESVWHISRSVSLIEYSSVAKTTDALEQKRITIRLFKLTFCVLFVVMGCILCIPEWVYTDYLFSSEFVGMRKVVAGLSVGIIALGSNNILSHYFIGTGRIRYSAFCSFIGLITLLIAGYLLIPMYGVTGSAVSTSIAFTAMLLFSLISFIKQTHSRLSEFLPNKEDWQYIRAKLS